MYISSIGITPTRFTGWTPIKSDNKKQIEKINTVLSDPKNKRIAISGHNFPDADSIGACLAGAYLLNKKTNRTIDVYIFGSIPDKFKYLQNPQIMNIIEVKDNEYFYRNKPKPYDVAISVDTSDYNLMDLDYYRKVFKQAKHTIKIDHHKTPERLPQDKKIRINYADINFTDATCPSAAELIMQLTKPLGIKPEELPKNFNNAVYIGILGDTGNFAYALDRQPFYDTTLLIKNGLHPERVQHRVISKMPKEVYNILTLAREKVEFYKSGNIAYLYLDEELTRAIQSIRDLNTRTDLEARLKMLVAGLREIEGVEVSAMIGHREGTKDQMYVSLRSSKMNIRNFAQNYGGGGHDKAAGFTISEGKKAEYTIGNILKDLQKEVDKYKKSTKRKQ